MRRKVIKILKSPLFLIIFSLFFILLLPVIFWSFIPAKNLNVWILNNTVPDFSYREHRGLMWTLNYFKISPYNHKYFRYHRDYYGFFPRSNQDYAIKDLSQAPDYPDLIYLADSYGVYTDEYLNNKSTGERSPLLYGGLSPIDLFRIKSFLRNGTTIIGEFNTFTSPTSPEIQNQLEDILGVRWKQWMGRYFHDLKREGEVTPWMVRNYEAQYKRPWTFKGPGYILASNWDEIVVLESGIDVGPEECYILLRDEYLNEFKMNKLVPYYYWIDFVEPMEGTEVIADFYLDVTARGKEKLSAIGLEEIFPAILRQKKKDYTSYYLSGDFADHTAVPRNWNYGGIHRIRQYLSINIKGEANAFFWRAYVPFMNKVLRDIRNDPGIEKRRILANKKQINHENQISQISKTDEAFFYVFRDQQWEPFFIKAVNMGMAMPGYWTTEFPSDENIYKRWFNMIAKMNLNAIRVYTLMDPSFYRALYLYNLNNPEQPLYLLQGIWPEEHPRNHNFFDKQYMDNFLKEIHYGIDAIHGNIEIPHRQGRAYGRYVADCSDYTLAFLIGRELEPQEVDTTNKLNTNYSYEGQYLSCTQGSPVEAWLAWSCDQAVEYETLTYQWQRPVSFVSWPTLDPLIHDAEWNESGDKTREWNDWVSVDINRIQTSSLLKGGFFGSYHIYPNFPDFMNNELDFYAYHDEEGRFLYGGYLKAFIDQHRRYPALVAEFGLATGIGNAHANPDGYHHGAQTEEEQANGIIRMFKNIHHLGYIGGVIFEWMDEWVKKTWTTEPFMIPFDRHVLWHNVLCPEQNYGIMANESIEPEESDYLIEQNDTITSMSLKADASYLYIDLNFKHPLNLHQNELIIGLDTFHREKGEFRYRDNLSMEAPSGLEFKISITKDIANLLVIPSYNTAKMKYQSSLSYLGMFEHMHPIINKKRIRRDGSIIEEVRENASMLYEGPFDESRYHYHWLNNGLSLRLRLPWGRLNVTDPSSHRVLDDPRTTNWYRFRDEYQTSVTEGFIITVLVADQQQDKVLSVLPQNRELLKPYRWKPWEEPRYIERLKKSYPILQDFLKTFP